MTAQLVRSRSTSLAGFLLLMSVVAINGDLLASTDPEKRFLFERLASAETEHAGRMAEDAIWRYWFDRSPTAKKATASR